MTKKRKPEANFQGEIKQALNMYVTTKNIHIFYRKEPDMGQTMPYDCYFVHKGIHIATELKVNESKRCGFNFKKMFPPPRTDSSGRRILGRDHQLYSLLSLVRSGGHAWVIIKLSVQSKRICRAFAIKVEEIMPIKDKTVSLEFIEKNSIEIKKIKDTRDYSGVQWDISFLFDKI